MKIKNEKAVLQAFCSNNDEFRPVLNAPFFNEKRNEVWATDGNVMLMADRKLLRRKYNKSERYTNLPIPEPNSDTIVDVKDIEAAFKRFDLKPEMVEEEGEECECTACDGLGEVQWTFTDDDGETYYISGECPVCDGTGRAKKRRLVPTGRMLPPKGAVLVIDGVNFGAIHFMKAVEGLRLLGCNQLHHIYTDVFGNNLFEVQDGIHLLVVPAYGDDCPMAKVKTTKMEADV